MGRENNARAKARFDRDAAEIARLTQQNTELQTQVEALTKELEEVKTHSEEAAAAGAPVDPGLTQELEALRADKANLEKALADAQAAHVLSSSEATGLTGTLVSRIVQWKVCRYLNTKCRRAFVLNGITSLLSGIVSSPRRPTGPRWLLPARCLLMLLRLKANGKRSGQS